MAARTTGPDASGDRWARNPPRQKRGEETLQRIIDATERLLEDRPFETITLAEIVRSAKTTTGSFYARFASKEALLPHLYERYDARLNRTLRESLAQIDWDRLDFADAVGRIVTCVVDQYLEQPWLLRAMAVFARAHPEALPRDVYDRRRSFHDQFAEPLRAYADRIDHDDPERALRFGLFMVASTARDKLLFAESPHAQVTSISERGLRKELTRALLAYLSRADPGTAGNE